MSAKQFLIPAISLAAVLFAGAAHAAAAGGQCRDTLDLNWMSGQADDGTFLSRVFVRNVTRGMIRVTVSYSGAGAIVVQPKTLQPYASMSADLVRTSAPLSTETLSANTRVGCSVVG